MRLALTAIALIVLLSACNGDSNPQAHAGSVESEIYASFLNQLDSESVRNRTIVIRQSAAEFDDLVGKRGDLAKEIRGKIPEASEQVVADFLRVGKEQTLIVIPSGYVRSGISYTLMSDSDYRDVFREQSRVAAWKRFQVLYPNSPTAFVQFSRVGYDPISEQSLLYVRVSCGPRITCGSGSLFLFKLKGSTWVNVKSVLWVIS